MRDVICIYHPAFRKSLDLRALGMKHPDIFNVAKLIEESLAAVGHYKVTDGYHADFSDGTDSKTASITKTASIRASNSYHGEITGVTTAGGHLKAGALRCTIYNPHKDSLRFYFLPKSMWSRHVPPMYIPGRRRHCGALWYYYNKLHDRIVKLHEYECSSFKELARAN